MSKIGNLINHILNWILNIIIAAGVAVILAWLVWDVHPHVSLMKTGYFFSDTWHFLTGQPKKEEYKKPVTREQLEESAQRTMRYYEY